MDSSNIANSILSPGSLAAWFRSKYPYMVDGAVASSAPIVAEMDFQGKSNTHAS